MAMKNPPHPGKLIDANLVELSVSVADAAKAMKVTRQQLYNVTRGKSAISPDMAIRLEKAFGGSADFWLAMQSAYDLAQARKEKNRGKFLSAALWNMEQGFRLNQKTW
jgi:addiction module HigA family antidote